MSSRTLAVVLVALFIVAASPARVYADPADSAESGGILRSVGLGAAYASTILVHAYDVHSTLAAMERGAIEVNPVMARLTERRALFLATKAAVAGLQIYATARIARHSTWKAILISVAANSAYVMIVRHNYAIARR